MAYRLTKSLGQDDILVEIPEAPTPPPPLPPRGIPAPPGERPRPGSSDKGGAIASQPASDSDTQDQAVVFVLAVLAVAGVAALLGSSS